jgi:hypothetical protein
VNEPVQGILDVIHGPGVRDQDNRTKRLHKLFMENSAMEYVVRLVTHHGVEYMDAVNSSAVADPAKATTMSKEFAEKVVSFTKEQFAASNPFVMEVVPLDEAVRAFRGH